MKNKRRLRSVIGEAIAEVVVSIICFAVGYFVLTSIGCNASIDSIDPDLTLLLGLAIILVIAVTLTKLIAIIFKKKAVTRNMNTKINRFIFTVDDNIIFLEELTKEGYASIFDHPYLAMYKRLHEKFGLKVQLNLFYEKEGFDLSMMPDKYCAEWQANADWLKASFHSRLENETPYIDSGYDEVYGDGRAVNSEILRFAGEPSLAKTTTIHWCRATDDGLKALADLGVRGLLGLYGTEEKPRSSYQSTAEVGDLIRSGGIAVSDGMAYAGIDIVLNQFDPDEIIKKLTALNGRGLIKVMIHEQYFHESYKAYQPNFEKKLASTFDYLTQNGYKSAFFEEIL